MIKFKIMRKGTWVGKRGADLARKSDRIAPKSSVSNKKVVNNGTKSIPKIAKT